MFSTLFREHQRTVYWAAFWVLPSRPDAEEVLQDAFLTLWTKRAGIHLVGESVLPCLVTTARYLALNRRRAEVRRPRDSLDTSVELVDGAPTPESLAIAGEAMRDLRALMATQPPVDQRIFELCLVEELSYDQAATRLGVTHATVRNRLSRLKSRLRDELTLTKGEPDSDQAQRRRTVVAASAVLLLCAVGATAWVGLTRPEAQSEFAYCYTEPDTESEPTRIAGNTQEAAVSTCASSWADAPVGGAYDGFTPKNDPGAAPAPASALPAPDGTRPAPYVCLRPDGAFAVFPLWPGHVHAGDADAFCAAVGLQPPRQP